VKLQQGFDVSLSLADTVRAVSTIKMATDEQTPLLAAEAANKERKSWLASLWSPAFRVLMAGFVISLSFSFTQIS
jgi:hypothetical protein